MTEVMAPMLQEHMDQDVNWKEHNSDFGTADSPSSADVCHDDHDYYEYHNLEFDLNDHVARTVNQETMKVVLRGKGQHNQSGSHTTGLSLWLSSQVACGYLLDNPKHIKDKSVLELGAGMGLVGIVAHHLGARKVVATDGDVKVLENLRYNIQRNAYDDCGNNRCSSQKAPPAGSVVCPQLVWGSDLDRFEDMYGWHDVILATDVFYFLENIPPIWETIDRLLKSNGKFILGFAPHGCVSIDKVLEAAKQKGFTWTKPNICEEEDDDDSSEDENSPEEDSYDATCSFGYHVFVFQREATN